jgi:uncharacterized protein (TIGR02594 family)
VTFSLVIDRLGRSWKLRLSALALLLPLVFALSSEAACASAHSLRQAPSARLHRIQAASHVRPHRVWLASRERPRRVWAVAYARPRHAWAFAPAYRRRVHAFASAQPLFDNHPVAAGGASSVVAEAMRFVGAGNVTGMRGAWCADYASMILRRTGRHPLAGRSVSAALAYGPHVRQPRPGDLVVINTRAGYAQHVGFFAGWDHGQMLMVSGNWRHRVAVAPISPRAVAAFIGV